MQKNRLIITAFTCVLIAVGLLAYLSFRQPDKKIATHLPQKKTQPVATTDQIITPTLPTIIIKNATLREVEKTKGYELVVTAQESRFSQLSDVIECSDVTCKISQKGLSIASIHAEKSFVNQLNKTVFLEGPVNGCFKDLLLDGCDI